MPASLSRLLQGGLRNRVIGVFGLLVGANVVVWAWAVAVLHATPALLGAALLAYSFGLRHAVDADHIAAIDNVTRKLMQQGRRPVGVGFLVLARPFTIVVAALSVGGRGGDHRDDGKPSDELQGGRRRRRHAASRRCSCSPIAVVKSSSC